MKIGIAAPPVDSQIFPWVMDIGNKINVAVFPPTEAFTEPCNLMIVIDVQKAMDLDMIKKTWPNGFGESTQVLHIVHAGYNVPDLEHKYLMLGFSSFNFNNTVEKYLLAHESIREHLENPSIRPNMS